MRNLLKIAALLLTLPGASAFQNESGQESSPPVQHVFSQPHRRDLYSLPVKVEEVELTFSATDEVGRPIGNLTVHDLRLRDDGRRPLRILSFIQRSDLPIRAGILIDTSRSVREDLRQNQRTASDFVLHILRRSSDKASVMRFDAEFRVKQGWTNDKKSLNAAVDNVANDSFSRLGGTALFDAIYTACHDNFNKNTSSGNPASNVILLFSDGSDNASHAQLQDDITACQQTHTAIYVFCNDSKHSHERGVEALRKMSSQSGGRIFYDPTNKGQLDNLQLMEKELRNNYLIVYKPAPMKSNGSFHRITMKSPRLHARIHTSDGYYADP